MELLEASEINVGLVLTKRLSPLAVRHEILISPYGKLMKDIHTSGKIDITELTLKYGPTVINAALHSVSNMNGLGELANWPRVLEECYAMYEAGTALEKM